MNQPSSPWWRSLTGEVRGACFRANEDEKPASLTCKRVRERQKGEGGVNHVIYVN